MGRNLAAWLLGSMMLVLLLSGCGQESTTTRQPGEAEFREANRLIIRFDGKAAMGNCPQAEQLAAQFAKAITELREQTIEKGHDDRLSLSSGHMLVFCELTETHCAFMVHVPELRKFTHGAKDVMTAICWHSAQETLRAQQIKRDHLAVGVKGAMLYETIIVGKTVDDSEESEDGIEGRTADTASLYPYFVGKPPSATVTAVARPLPAKPAGPTPAPMQAESGPVTQAPVAKPATPAPAAKPVRPLESLLSAEFGEPTSVGRQPMDKYGWTNPRDQMYRLYSGDTLFYKFGDLAVRAIYSTAKKPVFFSLTAPRKLTSSEIEAAKRVVLKEDPRGNFEAFVEKDGTLLTLVPGR